MGASWKHWRDGRQLGHIAGCLGGRALAAIFQAKCEDFSGWSGGMPDLLLWRVFEGDEEGEGAAGYHEQAARTAAYGEVRVLEVKSENDRLSGQQRAWIQLMLSAGINVAVCRVSPDGGEPEDVIR